MSFSEPRTTCPRVLCPTLSRARVRKEPESGRNPSPNRARVRTEPSTNRYEIEDSPLLQTELEGIIESLMTSLFDFSEWEMIEMSWETSCMAL